MNELFVEFESCDISYLLFYSLFCCCSDFGGGDNR